MIRNLSSLTTLGSAFLSVLLAIVLSRHDEQRLAASGIKLRRAFERVGGVYVKFGQMMAMRRDIFPETICDELMQLLDRVPPFEIERVKQIFREDFDQGIDDAFSKFDDQVIASASLGQVYVAQLKDGQKVAVKVRRPGIEETAVSDSNLLVQITRLIDLLPFINLRLAPLAKEFRDWIVEEVNYLNEANNLKEFAEYKTDLIPIFNIPLHTRLPKIYPELCSERVITMEFVEGITINKLIELSKDKDSQKYKDIVAQGYDIEKVLREITMTMQKQILLDGYFNADMHPANIMVNEKNEIYYIDFGLVGRLDQKKRIALRRLVRSLAFLDKETGFDAFCMVMDIRKVRDIERLRHAFYQMMDGIKQARTDSTDYKEQASAALFKMFGLLYAMKVQVPPEVAKAYRTIVTADGIVHALLPEASMEEVTKDVMRVMMAATYMEVKSQLNTDSLNFLVLKAMSLIEKELLLPQL